MTEQEVISSLERVGAYLTGHFEYTSGKHGNIYINKDAVYAHTLVTSRICKSIAKRFAGDSVQVVIAPAVGGVILAQWTAHHLSELLGSEVLSVYAEPREETLCRANSFLSILFTGRRWLAKQARWMVEFDRIVELSSGEALSRKLDAFVIGRGYDTIVSGKNVLVVEDVIHTGSTARKVVDAVRASGGNVVGLAAVVNRGGATERETGNPPKFISLVENQLDSYERSSCPLCAKKIPTNTNAGKGRMIER